MAHFSASANDAVAAAIRGFRAIGHLGLRANALSLKFCAALVESRREPMLPLPFVVRRGEPLKVPPPFGHASFDGRIAINRKGRSLRKGSVITPVAISLALRFFLSAPTTCARLAIS